MTSSSLATVLYDGHCSFCTDQAQKLKKKAGDAIELQSFQEPGVLNKFSPLTHQECMKEIKLITKEGKIYGGAAAIFYALSLKPGFSFLRYFYQIPGIKQILDFGYKLIAQNRYWIKKQDCKDGTCKLHS